LVVVLLWTFAFIAGLWLGSLERSQCFSFLAYALYFKTDPSKINLYLAFILFFITHKTTYLFQVGFSNELMQAVFAFYGYTNASAFFGFQGNF